MSLHSADIDRAWNKLGMEVRQGKDLHALFVYEGKVVTHTRRSKGTRKLDGDIPHKIRTQLRLSEEQFRDLIDCPLDRNQYVQILKEKKLIL